MNRLTRIRSRIFLVVLLVAGAAAVGDFNSVLRAAKQSRAAATMIPQFQFDPTWPKMPLPNKWLVANVIGLAVDANDHIWILQRPAGLTDREKRAALNPPVADCCIPAPPVIEFDQSGTVLQTWGGPGSGYVWPKDGGEHGLNIDHKGNMWVGTNNDSHILKFTRTGKFLLQIGRPGAGTTPNTDVTALAGATGSVDPQTNEVFVADGYQHRRVLVFDADTGVYKRHWGAYGKPPVGEGRWRNGLDAARAEDGPAGSLPQQFDTVTCARVSNDGLVYVCDRGNDRLQVFKRDGTFVTEKVMTMRPGIGIMGHDVAFSPDRGQRFLYVADPRNARIWILRRSDLEILSPFGFPGHFAGGFTNPSMVALDSKGNLYVGEGADGKRVQRFLYKGMRPASAN